jgi:hypothetical protein
MLVVLMLSPVTASEVRAQMTVIMDCQGFTRATQTTQPGTLTTVNVQVEAIAGGAAEGAQVTLTNALTGQQFQTTVSSGVASFQSVPAGTFTIQAASETLSMGLIEFAPIGFSPVVAGGVGAAVIGGGSAGLVGIGVTVADQIDGSNNSAEPTPIPTPPPAPQPPPPPPLAPDECRTCDPDAEPEPLDDFFADKAGPKARATEGRFAQSRLSPYS